MNIQIRSVASKVIANVPAMLLIWLARRLSAPRAAWRERSVALLVGARWPLSPR